MNVGNVDRNCNVAVTQKLKIIPRYPTKNPPKTALPDHENIFNDSRALHLARSAFGTLSIITDLVNAVVAFIDAARKIISIHVNHMGNFFKYDATIKNINVTPVHLYDTATRHRPYFRPKYCANFNNTA